MVGRYELRQLRLLGAATAAEATEHQSEDERNKRTASSLRAVFLCERLPKSDVAEVEDVVIIVR